MRIRQMFTRFGIPRWATFLRRRSPAEVLLAAALALQLPGLRAVWVHVSDEPVILGRYAVDYFLMVLAYHALVLAWLGVNVWFAFGGGKRTLLHVWGWVARLSPWHWLALPLLLFAWFKLMQLISDRTSVDRWNLVGASAPVMALILLAVSADPAVQPGGLLARWAKRAASGLARAVRPAGRWYRAVAAYEIVIPLPRWLPSLPPFLALLGCLTTGLAAVRGSLWGAGYWGTALTILVLLIVPGWLLSRLLPGETRPGWPGDTALWFSFGTAVVGAISALSRLAGLHVRYAVLGLAVFETACLIMIGRRFLRPPENRPPTPAPPIRLRLATLLYGTAALAGAVGILVAAERLAVFRYESGRDAWHYAAHVSWFLNHPAEPLQRQRIVGNLNLRMVSNGWLFINSALSWVQPVPPATLITINLNVILPLLALAAIFFLTYELSDGDTDASLLSVVFTACVPLLSVANVRGYRFGQIPRQGIPDFLLMRMAEDKAVAFFILLPVALGLTHRYLKGERGGSFVRLGIVLASLVLVHPMGLAGYLIGVAGFGLFHLAIVRRKLKLRKWLVLGLVGTGLAALTVALSLGLLLETRDTPAWTASAQTIGGMSLDDLFLPPDREDSGPPFLPDHFLSYRYNPLLLVAAGAAAALLIARGRQLAAQLLAGSTLLTIILLYMPGVNWLFAQVVSTEVSWRFLFGIPVGTILAFGFTPIPGHAGMAPSGKNGGEAASALTSLGALIGVTALLLTAYPHLDRLRASLLREAPTPAAWAVLRQLDELEAEGKRVFAPPDLNGMIMAEGRGIVLYTKPKVLSDMGQEWFDTFFEADLYTLSGQDLAIFALLVREFDFDFLILPRQHPLITRGFLPASSFEKVAENAEYTIYRLHYPVCWPLGSTGCQ